VMTEANATAPATAPVIVQIRLRILNSRFLILNSHLVSGFFRY
jgi:hypothetical protein